MQQLQFYSFNFLHGPNFKRLKSQIIHTQKPGRFLAFRESIYHIYIVILFINYHLNISLLQIQP